jgi:hypothetical protein
MELTDWDVARDMCFLHLDAPEVMGHRVWGKPCSSRIVDGIVHAGRIVAMFGETPNRLRAPDEG